MPFLTNQMILLCVIKKRALKIIMKMKKQNKILIKVYMKQAKKINMKPIIEYFQGYGN